VFLLNTNVVSERRKAGDGRADADVVAFLAGCDAAQFYLCSITIMKLELGICSWSDAAPCRAPGCAPGWNRI
jgi:predicted nucleic acid-binding protein